MHRRYRYRTIFESARIYSDNLSHNGSMQFSNFCSSTIFDMYFSSFEVNDLCRSSNMTRNILIADRFRSTQLYK